MITAAQCDEVRAWVESVILDEIKALESGRPAVDCPLNLRVWKRKQDQLRREVIEYGHALSLETLRRAREVLN